jgi:release factor glutamine methyltransferase
MVDSPQRWTVRTLLQWSVPWLTKQGVESARLESELLLGETLGLRRIDLIIDPHRPLTPPELTQFKVLLKRRAAREPMAYIRGVQAFWRGEFAVTHGVLIPRPDSETLIEAFQAIFLEPEAPLQILELGVGSGCLILTLLDAYPNARGVGMDIAEAPLTCTRHNADTRGVTKRLGLIRADGLSACAATPDFDAIITNPPYIRRGELDGLQPEVSRWEPRQALDGGPDGLFFYRQWVGAAAQRLRGGGRLLCEVGFDQNEAVRSLFEQTGLAEIKTWNDYGHRPRVVGGVKQDG